MKFVAGGGVRRRCMWRVSVMKPRVLIVPSSPCQVTFADAWTSSAYNALVVTAANENSVLKTAEYVGLFAAMYNQESKANGELTPPSALEHASPTRDLTAHRNATATRSASQTSLTTSRTATRVPRTT